MKSTVTLLVLTTTMSVALGAICNGKGLCMSLEISSLKVSLAVLPCTLLSGIIQ